MVPPEEKSASGSKPGEWGQELAETVGSYSREIADRDLEPVAKVELPSEAELKVRLVKLEDFSRFEDVKSDETKLFGFATTFFGAFLGILSNIITSDQHPSTTTWVASGLVLIFVFVLGYLHYEARKRALAMRNKLYSE